MPNLGCYRQKIGKMKIKFNFLGYVFGLLLVISISSCTGFLEVVDALASIDTSSSTSSSASSFNALAAPSSMATSTNVQAPRSSQQISQLQNNISSLQAEYDNLDVQLTRMKEANKNATLAGNAAKAQAMKKSGNNYGSVNNMTRLNVAKAGKQNSKPYSQDVILAHTRKMSDLRLEIASLKNQLATLEGTQTTENNSVQKKSESISKSQGQICTVCAGSGVCRGKSKCGGTGKCATCNGRGYYIVAGDNVACPNCASGHNGKCSRCNGTGKCSSCNGTGYR